MAKRRTSVRPQVSDALAVLGQLVKSARTQRTLTIAELAVQAGVAPRTIMAIEAGAPGTAAATLFNVADLVGVPLFGVDDRFELARMRRRGEETLALLPSRVRNTRGEPDDNL